jgi:hypothetical protein
MTMPEISLRDLFAAAALAGIMANPTSFDEDEDSIGGPTAWEWAYQLADAMMAHRDCPACSLDENGHVESPAKEA